MIPRHRTVPTPPMAAARYLHTDQGLTKAAPAIPLPAAPRAESATPDPGATAASPEQE